MALEYRKNRAYYYRSRRVNGRVVKEYVGSGAAAEEAAQRDAEEREALRKAEEQFQERKRQYEIWEILMQVHDICIEVVMNYTMTAAGYHRVNRGPWRKKRIKKEPSPAVPSGLAVPAQNLPQSG